MNILFKMLFIIFCVISFNTYSKSNMISTKWKLEILNNSNNNKYEWVVELQIEYDKDLKNCKLINVDSISNWKELPCGVMRHIECNPSKTKFCGSDKKNHVAKVEFWSIFRFLTNSPMLNDKQNAASILFEISRDVVRNKKKYGELSYIGFAKLNNDKYVYPYSFDDNAITSYFSAMRFYENSKARYDISIGILKPKSME